MIHISSRLSVANTLISSETCKSPQKYLFNNHTSYPPETNSIFRVSGTLNAQYLSMSVVADGDPVGLRGPPLDLVDLALGGRVGQDGVLDGARHLLDVPYQGLVVVARRADVARTGEWKENMYFVFLFL